MQSSTKRLFFGMEVIAPWPEIFPEGRLLSPENRHVTLAFLGKINLRKLLLALPSYPALNFKVGCVGLFDQCLFFPTKNPRVIAWNANIYEEKRVIDLFNNTTLWLETHGIFIDKRHPFTPHVTLARSPFNEKKWKEVFQALPFILKDVHLYESLGNLSYKSHWKIPLLAPIEELDHTADLAFLIRANHFKDLYVHAQFALAFHFPLFLQFLDKETEPDSLDTIIMFLNKIIAQIDEVVGCPFKAVSFHGKLKEEASILHWEMIIDV